MTPAQAHDDAGNSSYPGPRKFRTGYLNNVMAVAIKAFTLDAPTRVVIDVGR